MARILLIEDDEPVRTTLRLTLEHLGHTVIEAGNGTEGLALVQPATIDVVITDMAMPENDGLDVVRALRNHHPPVNIIAISGAGGARRTISSGPTSWARGRCSSSRFPTTC